MPEPFELFTNVYVKGLGVEVLLFHLLSLLTMLPFFNLRTVKHYMALKKSNNVKQI